MTRRRRTLRRSANRFPVNPRGKLWVIGAMAGEAIAHVENTIRANVRVRKDMRSKLLRSTSNARRALAKMVREARFPTR